MIVVLVLALALCAALFSTNPWTPVSAPPDASQVRDAKAAFLRIRPLATAKAPAQVSLSWPEVSGAATLVGRATKVERVKIAHVGETVLASASLPWRFGLWLNISASATASDEAFPSIWGRVGHVPVPPFAMRWIAGGVHSYANRKGAALPPLDELARITSISPAGLGGRVRLPAWLGPNDTLNPLTPVDRRAVVAHYCRVSAMEKKAPSPDLAALLRKGFAGQAKASDPVGNNRAILVALSIILVPEQSARIVGEQTQSMLACAAPYREIPLGGRADLAKHWTVSAALSASFGPEFTRALGTWKEIADSGPGGSGFSFVDLSADRSGVRFGQLASAPETAAVTARRLSVVSDERILPLKALALAEGLTEDQFQSRFKNIESARYERAIATIDRVLDRER